MNRNNNKQSEKKNLKKKNWCISLRYLEGKKVEEDKDNKENL